MTPPPLLRASWKESSRIQATHIAHVISNYQSEETINSNLIEGQQKKNISG